MRKLCFTMLFLLAVAFSGYSQNDPQISNYMFSEVSYNPAMAGVTSTMDASLIARQQWTGFDQAPRTQLFNISSYVNKMSGGVGFSVINDKLGYENSLNFKLMYAYQLRITDKSKLSFGLGFGMISKALKGSQLIYDDMTDVNGIYTDQSKMKPDFDFGVAFNSQKFIVGASVTHIDQSLPSATVLKAPRHFYLFGQYKIKASEKINFIPSVKVRSAQYITQFDASVLMYYASKFWLGATLRPGDAMVAHIGVDVTKNIRIGYSYDYNNGAVKSYSDGSHEIVLLASFDVAKKIIPTKTPRFFD
jgi:type IX secretion system PorP/SprF family membrane protein